jgi:hypothetical protein
MKNAIATALYAASILMLAIAAWFIIGALPVGVIA